MIVKNYTLYFLLLLPFSAASQQSVIRDVHFSDEKLKGHDFNTEYVINAFDADELKLSDFADSLDVFEARYGKNKKIPDHLRAEVLTALSFFPEFEDIHIEFKYATIKATMNAQPTLLNLFRPLHKRRYVILLNDNRGPVVGLNYDSLNFNQRVGWFGHELAHIYTYHLMSNVQTMAFVLSYTSSRKFIRKAERYTDYILINRGMGHPLYDGQHYLLHHHGVTDLYKKTTKYNSFSLREIIYLWKERNKRVNIVNEMQPRQFPQSGLMTPFFFQLPVR